MKIVSKFHTFYLIRKGIGPGFFSFLSLLFLYQGISLKDDNQLGLSAFLFLVAVIFLFLNLRSIHTIEIEETRMILVSLLTDKKKYIDFSNIKKSHLEFIPGVQTKAGRINPGHYECVFILDNNTKFIISPEKFENYHEIIKTISLNRTALDVKEQSLS